MSIDYNDSFFRNSLSSDLPEFVEEVDNEIHLELKNDVDKVLCLLRQTIEKLKISLIMPKILENPRVLQQHLKNTNYNHCCKLVQEYRAKRKKESMQEIDSNDYDTIQIIDYFQQNFKILDILPNWLDDVGNTEKYLLKVFEDVCQIAQQRFKRLAIADLIKEKRFHEVYLVNEEIKKEINEGKSRLKSISVSRRWKHMAKGAAILKLENDLRFLEYDNKMTVKMELIKSHKTVLKINGAFAAKQPELEESLNKMRSDFTKLLNNDCVKEKNIRDERNKLQIQLQQLIKRYDATIFEKHVEETLLQEEYDKEKQEFDVFFAEYEKQNDLYQELLRKQEQEYKELRKQKIRSFTVLYAVKKIQVWWHRLQKIKKAEERKSATGKKAAFNDGNKKNIKKRKGTTKKGKA